MLTVEKTNINGLLLIKPDVFEDSRGTYVQLYDSIEYEKILPEGTIFVQDDYSYSSQNVLRGIHGDLDTSKLISIVYGHVYDVVIDNRPDSSTYKVWQSFDLSRENAHQLFIPAGCGNGMYVFSREAVFHYKQTSHYRKDIQFTIKWNDSTYNIHWPMLSPILSDRDS